MIILDIETTGLTGRNGIWQIGALEFENPDNSFLQEGKIDDCDIVTEGALKICGKTESELRDRQKQSQKQLILNYFDWIEQIKQKIFFGENIGWDVSMIQDKCIKYGIDDRFRKIHGHRSMDIHTIAQHKWKLFKGVYLTDKNGKDDLGLSKNLEFCGLPDNRIEIRGEEIVKQGKPHNALEDCRLEAECVSRLLYGKNLFPEYSQYKIPEVLKK